MWPVIGLSEREKETLVTVSVHRIFVPIMARKTFLDNLHLPHMGIGITYQLAKTKCYWESMKEDIKKKCEGCSICLEFSSSKQNEEETQEE